MSIQPVARTPSWQTLAGSDLYSTGASGPAAVRPVQAPNPVESMDRLGGVGRMNELLHYMADRRVHAERWIGAMETTSLPMRFVWGDLDPVSGAHMIERVEERMGDNAVVNRMIDIGHWPPLEAPVEVTAALQELLGLPAS